MTISCGYMPVVYQNVPGFPSSTADAGWRASLQVADSTVAPLDRDMAEEEEEERKGGADGKDNGEQEDACSGAGDDRGRQAKAEWRVFSCSQQNRQQLLADGDPSHPS